MAKQRDPDFRTSSGDELPYKSAAIEVHVPELKRLFNTIDPSPFLERELDPKAEEFMVERAKDFPKYAQLALLVHLGRPAGMPNEAEDLKEALQTYFNQRLISTRRQLRELFRRGRTTLLIGIAFFVTLIVLGDLLVKLFRSAGIAEIVRESLLIGGWIAMWRPLEILLYEWWPVRNESKIFERLAVMPVQIRYSTESLSDEWQSDWPAARTSGSKLT